jgi:hypothetical protein
MSENMNRMHERPILVVGYYNHFNLGDEQYKVTIPYLLGLIERTTQDKPADQDQDQELFTANYRLDRGANVHGANVHGAKVHGAKVQFVDCDRLASYQVPPHAIIVMGGGDILNQYFLDKLNAKFSMETKVRGNHTILAFSVGIPYNDIFTVREQREKLEILDHVFLRTLQDIPIFGRYFDKTRLHYLPDTSCLVYEALFGPAFQPLNVVQPTKNTANNNHILQWVRKFQGKQPGSTPFMTSYEKILNISKRKRVIGVMFCRHIYHPDHPYIENYRRIVKEFADLLDELVQQKYYIVLLPFNTKMTGHASVDEENKENDLLIHRDVMKHVKQRSYLSIHNLDFELTLEQTLAFYSLFYMTIPMRFHATLFSVYAGVPMVPIYTTKKIRNFLLDIQWGFDYVFETNARDLPLNFNRKKMMGTIQSLTNTRTYYISKQNLQQKFAAFKACTRELIPTMHDVFEHGNDGADDDDAVHESETYLNLVAFEDIAARTDRPRDDMVHLDDVHQDNAAIQTIITKLQALAKEHGLDDFRDITDPDVQKVAVSIVSYYLTNHIDSPYNHGLQEKMFSYNYPFVDEWNWVLDNWSSKKMDEEAAALVPLQNIAYKPRGSSNLLAPDANAKSPLKFNLGYIDQNDRSGAHRSGWKYVYDNIKQFNDPKCPVYLDLYVDRTFHWKRDIYKYIDVIPYKNNPWVGVIHHTFDETFSDYNNHRLLKCPEFIQSLPMCRGLIVLSNSLETKFFDILKNDYQLDIQIPMFVLTHPTEINVPMFDYAKFLDNPDKKLLHVGGWLRNIFSFYQLEIAAQVMLCDKPRKSTKRGLLTYHRAETPEYETAAIPEKPVSRGWSGCCGKNVENQVIHTDVIPPPAPVPHDITPVPPHTKAYALRKCALKGKYMNNYFPHDELFDGMCQDDTAAVEKKDNYVSKDDQYCSSGGTKISNNWMRHLVDYVRGLTTTVEIIEYLDNFAYDEMLTANIVFLNLVDGSAVNTLIECLVRNTPVIVNRHPATLEVLGAEYPLFYDNIKQVKRLLRDPQIILQAHLYMKKIDKKPYNIKTFIEKLTAVFATITY